ncbi:MAG TPA: M23 family metallopeptidase [Flavobacteriales bacterium]|nr:M23 family metallopeptidase [Flavobacteriales bacterium]
MEKPVDSRRKQFIRKLRHKYRLVVMNDETFEEKYSLKLSQLNLFTALGLLSIVLIILTTFVIAFTPLREYIPGYSSDVRMRRNLLVLAEKVDSLKKSTEDKDALLDNIQRVMNGSVQTGPTKPRQSTKPDMNAVKLTASEKETQFREQVEEQDRYNLNNAMSDTRMSEISNYYFFTPLKGKVTTTFNPALKHYGIDVVAPKNEAVKSTLDGTVIFAGWTSETGHVIQIQHSNNLVSLYKHNSVLLKKEGEEVKAGEAIAITGNSGELTTSPHLHFELWYDGKPIDPQELMVF